MNNELVQVINQSFDLETTESNFVNFLTEKINYLIIHDFNKLIYILYRADINEAKLNKLLAENKKEDAGKIIAALFIQRQMEKIKSREAFSKEDLERDSSEERW